MTLPRAAWRRRCACSLMLVLFDQGTPVSDPPISYRPYCQDCGGTELEHSIERQLADDAAEAAGFDILVTTDKNFTHQQNLQGRKIAIVVLGNQQWPVLRVHVGAVVDAVNAALPASYVLVEIPSKKTHSLFRQHGKWLCHTCQAKFRVPAAGELRTSVCQRPFIGKQALETQVG